MAPKIRRPPIADRHIIRQRLMDHLTANRTCPLILISGPAGFGKTTLLSAWLAQIDWLSAWISLDEQDDASTLLHYMVAAIQSQLPQSMHRTAALLQAVALPDEPLLSDTVVNDLDEIDQPFILALDDYHVISSSAVHRLVAEILRHPPGCFHLALVTRHDPPLPLHALRVKGKMAEIRSEDLRLNLDEIVVLAKHLGIELSPHAVRELTDSMDGWIAGLQMAVLSMHQRGQSDMPQLPGATTRSDLMAYLVDEILNRQPASVQEFLVKTSILDEFEHGLCEAVAGKGAALCGGRPTLDMLAERNVFVSRVDQEGRTYRYHHLFRTLLQAELRMHHSQAEIAQLHLCASKWLERAGRLDAALQHALRSGDTAYAAAFVGRHRHTLTNGDHWLRLEKWLSYFTREDIYASPDLLLAKISLAAVRFQRTEVAAMLAHSEHLFAGMPPTPDRDVLQGETAAYWGFAYSELGQYHLGQKAIRKALQLIPGDRWTSRMLALVTQGYFDLMQGDPAAAFKLVYDTVTNGQDQGPGFQMRAMGTLGLLHCYDGDLTGMRRAARETLRLGAASANAPDGDLWVFHANWSRFHLGLAHYQRNELAQAEQLLGAVVTYRYQSYLNCATMSLFVLALTQQAQGRPAAASETAELASQYVVEMKCPDLMPATEIFHAQLALQQGRLTDAATRVARVRIPETFVLMPFYFVPYTVVARVWLATRTPESLTKAETLLWRLREHAVESHNNRLLIEVHALEALLAHAQHDERAALAHLEHALVLAQPSGFIRMFADLGAEMGDLLKRLRSSRLSADYLRQIVNAISTTHTSTAPDQSALIEPLTERELEVLGLLQKRLSDKEIAATLFIAPGTVKRHTHAIFQKLGASSRHEAVTKAVSMNILAFS